MSNRTSDRSVPPTRDHYGLVLALLVVSFLLTAFKPSEQARAVPLV